MKPIRFPYQIVMAGLLLIPSLASAALEIKAKAAKTATTGDIETWVVQVELENNTGSETGPLKLQYRFSGYRVFDEDRKPEGPLEHTEGIIDCADIPVREKTSVVSKGLTMARDQKRTKPVDWIKDIRVRAWKSGKLVGQFPENGGKGGESEWPLNPPPVPSGAEAGSGPWLLVTDGRAEFSGITLGASASQVFTMLQSQGSAKPLAKPEPFLTHPLRMTTADLPGCLFAFDAAKKLSAIEITDAARTKLPGGLLLGKSALTDFGKVLGTSEPVPAGASSALRFKLDTATLTIRDNTAAPGTAAAILLK